jgi:hypothetical protein
MSEHSPQRQREQQAEQAIRQLFPAIEREALPTLMSAWAHEREAAPLTCAS